jgi:hypothetical protein
MSLYSDAGREQLAKWLINCVYIDLAFWFLILIFNFSGTYGYIQELPSNSVIVFILVLFYIGIINSIRNKLRKLRDGNWRKISEIFASFYFFIHEIFYIFVIELFLFDMYAATNGIQIAPDFLLTWAIILGVLIFTAFYFHYRKSSSSEYEYGKYREIRQSANTKEIKTRSNKDPEDSSCFICGKKEGLPFRGNDGRYYCKDHILPENRVNNSLNGQTTNASTQALDRICENPRCKRAINHKDIIQCGPCAEIGKKRLFCKYCWESHRWSHGKSPAVGISYRGDGTYSGYDGTESFK